LAIIFATTPGPAMAIVATVFYLAAAVFSPNKGLLFKMIRKRRLLGRIRMEDILKLTLKATKDGSINIGRLSEVSDIRRGQLRKYLRSLSQSMLLESDEKFVRLTDKGIQEASRLVRAHRLWETYLVNQVGLNDQQIHAEAEKYEHLLTDEILDEVDAELGFPTTDPHGSPIPSKRGRSGLSLWQMGLGDSAKISKNQPNQLIAADLWKMGLLPESAFQIESKSEDRIILSLDKKTVEVKRDLANQINTEL